jgi:serine/threonine-protein kinase Chk2
VSKKQQLPSPDTKDPSNASSSSDAYKEATATPPEGRPSQLHHRPMDHNSLVDAAGFSSPPQETQAFSQFVYPTSALSNEVEDETKEGVWGYLLPLDPQHRKTLVLKKRNACPLPDKNPNFGKSKKGEYKDFELEEEAYEETKLKGIASGGYLVGRHPECGTLLED